MSVRRSAGISASAVLIILIQTSAMGNVAFESSDVDLDGWQSPPHDEDTILQMNHCPTAFYLSQNDQYVLKIESPPGEANNAYIDSHQIIPFQGNSEYYVELYIYPVSGPFHWFYIYNSYKITIFIDYVNNGQPIVRYYANGQAWTIGPMLFNQWNSLEIHANVGEYMDFEASINHGDWVPCEFNNRQSNGDTIRFGDDEFGQSGNYQNYGHCYFDNIRIYHPPKPSDSMNNYDLSEDFAMGKDYKNGGTDAKDFWTAQYNGNGIVCTINNGLNVDRWNDRSKNIYINCPVHKKAWAETPHFLYNPQQWASPRRYWISMWIYIDDSNCNFFHVVYNGHVCLVVNSLFSTQVKLRYVMTTADKSICNLNIRQWYKINIKVVNSGPGSNYYIIYIDNQLIIPEDNNLTDPNIPFMYNDIVKDNNGLTYLQMGIDTADAINYGEMYWDRIRFDQ